MCYQIFPSVSQWINWSFENPSSQVGTKEEKLGIIRFVRDRIYEEVKEFIKIAKIHY